MKTALSVAILPQEPDAVAEAFSLSGFGFETCGGAEFAATEVGVGVARETRSDDGTDMTHLDKKQPRTATGWAKIKRTRLSRGYPMGRVVASIRPIICNTPESKNGRFGSGCVGCTHFSYLAAEATAACFHQLGCTLTDTGKVFARRAHHPKVSLAIK
jgi:hypothetical protein